MAGSIKRAQEILEGIRPYTARGVLMAADREKVAAEFLKAVELVGTDAALDMLKETPQVCSVQILEIAESALSAPIMAFA